ARRARGAARDDRGPERGLRGARARADRRRTRAARRRARRREDAGVPRARGGRRRGVPARPVHARSAAVRHRGNARLRSEDRRVRDGSGAAVRERGARRRDQPRTGEGAVGAARRDAGAAGDDRAADARPPRSVRRPGDDEPVRQRRDVPAAARAARPVSREGRRRVPFARRRARDRRPLRCRRAAAADRRRDDRRRPALAARGARGLRRRRAARLRRGAGARDARCGAGRARREPARRARARAARPRARVSRRPRFRDAGRRTRRGAGGAAASALVGRPDRPRGHRSRSDRARDRPVRPGAVNALRAAIVRHARAVPRAGTAVRGARPGDGFVFSQLRAYAEGDDPRRIDHAATARSGALQTRVYLEETALVLAAFVDESASMRAGRRRALADAATEALRAWFGAAEGEDAVARIVDRRVVRDRRAAPLVTASEPFAFAPSLALATRTLPRGASLLAIADGFDLPDDDDALALAG